ncbi:MAG: DHH family phosphoesterase [Oscillospiraceae bacterium]|nr:DHH family phosphoesterase [Oscillospiraceae bacterium]
MTANDSNTIDLTDSSGSLCRDLLLSFDYGDSVTWVIGHRSPDSDTVGSAMACADLLQQIGIPARAAVSASVSRETRYALDYFGIAPPPVLSSAEGKQFILVDHSSFSQAIAGMQNARIAGIIDHHGIGDVLVSERIPVLSAPVGATATLVFMAYGACRVKIPRDMARVMLMAILSDTRGMTSQVTAADRIAYTALLKIAEISDPDAFCQGMLAACNSYDGMTDWEVFLSDYREYMVNHVTFGIGNVAAFGEPETQQMADRMHTLMNSRYAELGSDMLFTIIKNKGETGSAPPMYMVACGKGAAELLRKAFGRDGDSKYYPFPEKLSRKTDIVPALSAALSDSPAVAEARAILSGSTQQPE